MLTIINHIEYKKNFIDRSPFLYKVYHESFLTIPLHKLKQLGVFMYHKSRAAVQFLETVPRLLGFRDSRFMPLKNFKNKYKGKRVFITCTGPSLTIEDLEKLKNEYVFGMNSIALIHDKTDWVPDFFSCQDEHVFDKIKDTMLSTNNGQVFLPYSYKHQCENRDDYVYYHICGAYHIYELIYGPKYFTKFKSDCYINVYDGYSITYTILQLVMYMGFDEIYLLGADCNYLGEKQHFIEHGVSDNKDRIADAAERLTVSYSAAKRYADSHGVKIFNATRGGCLELFTRVDLDAVISTNHKNKIAD